MNKHDSLPLFNRSVGGNVRREGKRHPAEMLKGMLESQSRETNESVKKYGLNGLLKGDATLDAGEYTELFSKEIIQFDATFVREREVDFSGARIPNVQDFYREKYGAKNEDEHVAKW